MMYYGFLAILAFFRAPLVEAPSDAMSTAKPPWPFLWMYGFENVWGIKVVVYATSVLFLFLILVPLIDRKQARKWKARKGILILAASLFSPCADATGLVYDPSASSTRT